MTGPVVTIFPLRLDDRPEVERSRIARMDGPARDWTGRWHYTSVPNACYLMEKWLKKEREKSNANRRLPRT